MNKSTAFFKVCCSVINVFLLVTVISACSREPSPAANPIVITPPVLTDTNSNLKSFLALGDSYTIGSAVTTEERFPVKTRTMLMLQNVQMKQPDIIAVSGWTTGSLLSALNNSTLANNYDVVTLLIGVNNQYQGRSQAEYSIHFADLLNRAVSFAAGRKNRVFVLSIPDYSVTPFAQNSDTARIAREIDEFNAINKQITISNGIAYLDITPISREARTDPSLIALDGLHPSGKQYSRWSTLLAPMIKAVL